MKIAVAIDDWKRGIFEEALKAREFHYIVTTGLTAGTTILVVTTDLPSSLESVVRRAEKKAQRIKSQRHRGNDVG